MQCDAPTRRYYTETSLRISFHSKQFQSGNVVTYKNNAWQSFRHITSVWIPEYATKQFYSCVQHQATQHSMHVMWPQVSHFKGIHSKHKIWVKHSLSQRCSHTSTLLPPMHTDISHTSSLEHKAWTWIGYIHKPVLNHIS